MGYNHGHNLISNFFLRESKISVRGFKKKKKKIQENAPNFMKEFFFFFYQNYLDYPS
jgi:hypothetical protein